MLVLGSTCFGHHYARHQELTTIAFGYHIGHLVHEMATYRCDDARGCVMQFWHPDDEHICSKHVEAWNKLTVKQKFGASSWLITEINILRCTVNTCLTHIWLYNVSVKHNKFQYITYYLGQHVSTLIESSSGPSKIQILTNNVQNA